MCDDKSTVPVTLDADWASSELLSHFKTHLARYARPHWGKDSARLGLKVFADGMTNVVIGVFNQDSREDGTVILRIYGKSTERFIDRNRELACMQLMHRAEYAPPLYCQFANGVCCGFVPGRCISALEMGEPRMMQRIAVCLAQVHSVHVSDSVVSSRRPVVWDMCDWILRVPLSFSDANKDARFKELFGSLDALKAEGERLREGLSSLHSPVVFSHNDTQARNLVYWSCEDKISVIDYEYAGMNYAAFDLGNFFCEFSGAEELDFSRYPDEGVQKTFLKMYLGECAKLGGKDPASVSDEQVNKWYRDAAKCALASHLVWTYWGLLQAAYSALNYDFLRYSYVRFTEYQKRKKEVYLL
ncbi:hypothetical protein EMCRGX_G010040 [Ephydatia muelleri]